MNVRLCAFLVLSLAAAGLLAAGDGPPRSAQQAALAPLQGFVGVWRGVGQRERGSTKGAWTEQCQWAWKFAADRAELAFESPDGKYFTGGALRPGDKAGDFILAARSAAGESRYAGRVDDAGQLVLSLVEAAGAKPAETPPADADFPQRISLRLVAGGERLVVLYERKLGDRYTRLAEAGLTRQGGMFVAGTGLVECVVTGGQGTIPVTYKGQTYYVCCTGCRDLFNANPEAVLAEYRAKKK